MYPMVRLIIAATIFAFAGFSTGTLAQVAETQIKLTEKQVEGFITVQAEIATVKLVRGMEVVAHENRASRRHRWIGAEKVFVDRYVVTQRKVAIADQSIETATAHAAEIRA